MPGPIRSLSASTTLGLSWGASSPLRIPWSRVAAAGDEAVEELLHLALANRGILLTPFHNMALMAPTTTDADVDEHTAAFAEVVGELVS